MKLHFMGRYSGNEDNLPTREHVEGAVQFKEPEMKKFHIIINILAIIIFFILVYVMNIRAGDDIFNPLGILLSFLCTIPHEFLHAIFFKNDVYMYSNLHHGTLFVIGTESMGKIRYIIMCLFPNMILGWLPFISFLFCPSLSVLGTLGLVSTAMGAGDYLNVFFAITQIPKGCKTYLSGSHSYWYQA